MVKTNDPVQENNIMTSGLTFSIDMKGRLKSTFSTSFPYPASTNPGTAIKAGESVDQKRVRANFANYKKISVSGFRDVNEDELSANNTYGIKTALGYDADGSLVYEEVIPLALFRAGDLAKKEWAFNVKLNSVAMLAMLGGDAKTVTKERVVGYTTSAIVGYPSDGSALIMRSRNGMPMANQSITNATPAPTTKSGTPTIDFWGKFTLAQ